MFHLALPRLQQKRNQTTNAQITAPTQLQQCDVNDNDIKQCCNICSARIRIVNASLPEMRPKNNEKTKKNCGKTEKILEIQDIPATDSNPI